jgi:hypothetical protein
MPVSVRVKYQAAVYGGLLGAVLIVLGIASLGAAGYTYANPPTEQIQPQETDIQQFETTIEHRAEVTRSTPLYNATETVENQPVYFINATPTLQLTAVATLPDDRAVNASHTLLFYRQVAFQGTTFWEETEVINSEQAVVEDGELRIEAELDIPSEMAQTSEIDTAVADVGSVTTGIRLRTTYQTESAGGQPYEGELTTQSVLQTTGTAYWFGSDLAASQTESQMTEGRVETQPRNFTAIGALGLLGIVLIAGGFGLASWSSRSADVQGLEEQVYRSRYDEWISEGDFPTDAGKQYVYINSLEDLVDIAIDTGKRVIHDPELETYGVVDDDLVYYHASDPTTIDSWVNFTRDES